jgi:hypothetical protein
MAAVYTGRAPDGAPRIYERHERDIERDGRGDGTLAVAVDGVGRGDGTLAVAVDGVGRGDGAVAARSRHASVVVKNVGWHERPRR